LIPAALVVMLEAHIKANVISRNTKTVERFPQIIKGFKRGVTIEM